MSEKTVVISHKENSADYVKCEYQKLLLPCAIIHYREYGNTRNIKRNKIGFRHRPF